MHVLLVKEDIGISPQELIVMDKRCAVANGIDYV